MVAWDVTLSHPSPAKGVCYVDDITLSALQIWKVDGASTYPATLLGLGELTGQKAAK